MTERIRREVEKSHFRAMPQAGAVTISMGALSILPSNRPTLDDVYPVADSLLYRAKQTRTDEPSSPSRVKISSLTCPVMPGWRAPAKPGVWE